MLFAPKNQTYPDDIFADTRMSFGDHIDVLRTHLLRAIYGLLIVLVGGFVLDFVGDQLGNKYIGVGKPMLSVITEPVEQQVRDFYAKRNARYADRLSGLTGAPRLSPEEVEALNEKIREGGLTALTAEERQRLLSTPVEMPMVIPVAPFEKVFGPSKDPAVTELEVRALVYPAQLNYLSQKGEGLLESRKYLTALSAQEGMVVYFKVSILCSIVLASPWIFYQVWAFVAAGLYPHERAYVYRFLGPSIGLFLAGVLLCQFVVLPGAVRALLGFNMWIDIDPDIRLNEWLSFAILLPLVFGIAFQTPLVMFVLNRLGTFGWEDYWSKWRYAVVIMAFVSALITPTPDAVTMLYLFVPMFGLYMLGVLICKYFPPAHEQAYHEAEEQVAV
jgi:sec-independent protein translocase protein TatC